MSASLALINFTLVNRAWETLPDAELMAAFQYYGEALFYAKGMVASASFPKQCHLIVTNTYDGTQTIVWPPKADATP